MAKKMIWTSEINMEDWEEFLEEEYPKIKDKNEQYDLVRDYIIRNLEDERQNLNIPTNGKILIIADLGLWDGRRSGYKIIDKRNINAILTIYYEGETEYYSDGWNIKGIWKHHDGTNYYEFREIREGKHIDNLLNRLYCGKPVSRKMINYYTKSIAPQVNAVYGW